MGLEDRRGLKTRRGMDDVVIRMYSTRRWLGLKNDNMTGPVGESSVYMVCFDRPYIKKGWNKSFKC